MRHRLFGRYELQGRSPRSKRASGLRPTTAALALAAAVCPLPAGVALAAEGGSEDAAQQGLYLVPMEEITVPIIESDRVNGALRFKLVLAARDSDGSVVLRRQMPELRAAGIAAGLEFARLDVSGLRPVDAISFSERLSTALSAVDPSLARVLIVELAAEPA